MVYLEESRKASCPAVSLSFLHHLPEIGFEHIPLYFFAQPFGGIHRPGFTRPAGWLGFPPTDSFESRLHIYGIWRENPLLASWQ
jgi:hypothetical protein